MVLTFGQIVDDARKQTGGLPDPDNDSWKEGLAVLLKDHADAKERITERGWAMLRSRYVNCLATRIQVDEYHRRNPELADTAIERPVFILGLPRTGTTMLSYLMESDPANRSMLRWEAYNVVPPAKSGELRTDPRCLEEVAKDEMMLERAAKVAAAHFEPGDGPTECVHLVAQDFRSLMLAVTNTTPTYHDWLMFTDMASAFEHRKRVLQILQINNPGRWILKMPSDSLFVRQLFKTFPDAQVIWTHRDPYDAFASSFGMRGGSRPFSEVDENREYMRQYFPLQLALHVARPLEVSKERPDDFYHLYYDDMIADPLGQVKKIYKWIGSDWTEASEAAMSKWIKDNPKNKHGKHKYSLEEWGFSREELEPYFSDYLREHPVAKEKVIA